MYPAEYFSLFPPFPREDRIFVAMDFGERFRSRWERVIRPAVDAVRVNNVPQSAHRVDARSIGDSILTEILKGITSSRLIVADVTAIEGVERRRSTGETEHVALRNANVMYEVGLAHAARLPEEVLLFRSDHDPLMFDVAQIRVNTYDPDGAPDATRAQVTKIVVDALNELRLRRHMAVERAATRLDAMSWQVLTDVARTEPSGTPHPEVKTIGEVLSNAGRLDAIHRLLDVGAIQMRFIPNDPDSHKVTADLQYHLTPFGAALSDYAIHALGFDSPELG